MRNSFQSLWKYVTINNRHGSQRSFTVTTLVTVTTLATVTSLVTVATLLYESRYRSYRRKFREKKAYNPFTGL